jgi:hypothetical protein
MAEVSLAVFEGHKVPYVVLFRVFDFYLRTVTSLSFPESPRAQPTRSWRDETLVMDCKLPQYIS